MKDLLELLQFIQDRKVYWIAPIIIITLLIGVIIFYSSGSAIAPFIYTLF